MPGTLLGPLWNERTYGTSVTSAGLEVQTLRLPFLVKGKTRTGGMLEALACPDLPRYGDSYAAVVGGITTESDDRLLVKGKSAAQHDDQPQYWRVEVEYSEDVNDPTRQDRNPLLLPAEFKYSRERGKEALEQDLDGVNTANTAGVPYQAVEVDEPVRVIEVSRNLQTFEPDFWDAFDNLVSDEEFACDGTFYEPFRCRVFDVSTEGRKYSAACGPYWPTKLMLHVKKIKPNRPKPWNLYLVDIGDEYWDDAAGRLVRFNDQGRQLAPQLLNGIDGGPNGHGDAAHYNEFRIFPYGSYAELAALFGT